MTIDHNGDRPAISYPTTWEYKVIGQDEKELRRVVNDCLADWSRDDDSAREWELTASRVSKGGQYISLRLELVVNSETERDALFQTLSMLPEIRLVI